MIASSKPLLSNQIFSWNLLEAAIQVFETFKRFVISVRKTFERFHMHRNFLYFGNFEARKSVEKGSLGVVNAIRQKGPQNKGSLTVLKRSRAATAI